MTFSAAGNLAPTRRAPCGGRIARAGAGERADVGEDGLAAAALCVRDGDAADLLGLAHGQEGRAEAGHDLRAALADVVAEERVLLRRRRADRGVVEGLAAGQDGPEDRRVHLAGDVRGEPGRVDAARRAVRRHEVLEGLEVEAVGHRQRPVDVEEARRLRHGARVQAPHRREEEPRRRGRWMVERAAPDPSERTLENFKLPQRL